MPEFFVARDRARRVGWNLEKVLQERRLAWRGAEIGMSSLRDDADVTLSAIAEDARTSAKLVLDGELRDRERGFMEIPFVVAMTTVAWRVETAAALESGRRARRRKAGGDLERQVEAHLVAALGRLEAFQAAYDDKAPLAEPASTDLAHLLTQVTIGGGRPWDVPPPPVVTSSTGLGDLLVAIRAALPGAEPMWHVTQPGPGRPLGLALGWAGGEAEETDLPPEVLRATDVLAYCQPIEVTAWRSDEGLQGIGLTLSDPAGESLQAAVAVLTGGDAHLGKEAERAVHALLAAPSVPESGDVPPTRLVALLGVLQAVDRVLETDLAPRLVRPQTRIGAGSLPRDDTRKAPLKRPFLAGLAELLPDAPVDTLSSLAAKVAANRIQPKALGAMEIALLLAVLGRDASVGGTRLEACVDMRPLTDEDVLALTRDLTDVASIRRRLESGERVDATSLSRLECAAVAVLGRLGRLG